MLLTSPAAERGGQLALTRSFEVMASSYVNVEQSIFLKNENFVCILEIQCYFINTPRKYAIQEEGFEEVESNLDFNLNLSHLVGKLLNLIGFHFLQL